ncbi:phenylacetic acid degradation protein [Capsulimonas corticalis]|uniref:Phenylacetic acid degradation protein n=1 Tax=Capsulimonas corticalis TaxID=2219043 RepID=A0A402CQS4_9BACT|nr:PaaI family thioesterase [Capsulimonas corticalis]BDI34359.1 phenylacetic acid degradation protein [Capsulimonas corticalis]
MSEGQNEPSSLLTSDAGNSSPLLRDDGMCFGCGSENPIGLHLTFAWDGDTYGARFVPEACHQGWVGRVHGGILALVLDEVLSRAALERHGLDWVTAELTTRLVRPAPTGEPLIVRGRIDSVRSKMILCSGEVVDERSGAVIARGVAKMMRPR